MKTDTHGQFPRNFFPALGAFLAGDRVFNLGVVHLGHVQQRVALLCRVHTKKNCSHCKLRQASKSKNLLKCPRPLLSCLLCPSNHNKALKQLLQI
jgi:hypothetical protein